MLFCSVFSCSIFAQDRPNVLWITSEDNAAHWLGCYGNKEAKTPNIDALATQSIFYDRCYSHAAVCAVSRFTILTGVHSPSAGTQHMRSRHAIPSHFTPYVSLLRKAGYYCTNANKTDYNFKGNDASLWDDCSAKAHYKNRSEGQPFFAIFNLQQTHESQIFSQTQTKKSPTRLKPAQLSLPGFLPDLPEIRADVSAYHDRMTIMDENVGSILADLRASGLAENTVVFYYSDHGGATPRGKRYLQDSGVRVPLLIHLPDKWKPLGSSIGKKISDPVGFVDLAPTLLSICGVDIPAHMQGSSLLSPQKSDRWVFLYADRFDEIYGMRRGITNGKWKYIRCFTSDRPAAPYSFYQFGQAGWRAWRMDAETRPQDPRNQMWQSPTSVEMLYEIGTDPDEIKNLAKDPSQAERLKEMRQRLQQTMIDYRDTGIVHEALFDKFDEKNIHAAVNEKDFPYQECIEMAFAGDLPGENAEKICRAGLMAKHPIVRYWAGMSLLQIVKPDYAKEAEILLKQEHSCLRCLGMRLMWRCGQSESAIRALVRESSSADLSYTELLDLLNLAYDLRRDKTLSDDTWKTINASLKGKEEYTKRIIEEIR